MDLEQREKLSSNLLDAIKKDNISAFKKLIVVEDCKYYTYGRFPVLSLCYLWDSWKIISSFEKYLIKINEGFIDVGDDLASYARFKRQAKRALRLYVDNDKLVTPLEMLAVLQKNIRLSRTIKKYGIEDKEARRVERIYSMSRKQTATIQDRKITISREKISISKLATIIICFVVSAIMIAASAIFYVHTYNLKQGTEESPFNITNSAQLDKISSTSYYCVLQDDIKVEAKGYKFSGSLDFNGHSLIVENSSISLIQELKGSFKNGKIVIRSNSYFADDDFSPVMIYNDGTVENMEIIIENSSISVSDNLQENNENKTRYLGLICAQNYGEITSSSVSVNGLELNGNANINSTFGGIAGMNNISCLIKDCSTVSGSTITADTIDIGGIVGENDGQVINCTNNASLSQTTNYENWSPNVAGIAFNNDGYIENCINKGALSVTHTLETVTTSITCSAGGITVNNHATIIHSKNEGNISASANGAQMIVGGVTALNYANTTYIPIISESGSLCEITINNKGDKEQLIGGIVGYVGADASLEFYIRPQIEKTFTYVNVIDHNTETTLSFIGGTIGFIRTGQSNYNYYVGMGEYFGVGGYAGIGGAVRPTSDEGMGTTRVNTLEELKQTEVYW